MKARIFALALAVAAGLGLSGCASGTYCDPVYGCGYATGYTYGAYPAGYTYGAYPGYYYGSGYYRPYAWRRGVWAHRGWARGGWYRGGYGARRGAYVHSRVYR